MKLPKSIDSFGKMEDGYLAEYDGWHFEAKTIKGVASQIVRYILKEVNQKETNYKKAYSILMEYWDSLPDDEKNNIDKRLKKVGC